MTEVVRREAPLTLGLSTGLVYNPAVYCDQREITALVRAFNEREARRAVSASALGERQHHRQPQGSGRSLDRRRRRLLQRALQDRRRAKLRPHERDGEILLPTPPRSIPTMENMYPYTAGSTTGDAIFPPEMRAGWPRRISGAAARSGGARGDGRQDAP